VVAPVVAVAMIAAEAAVTAVAVAVAARGRAMVDGSEIPKAIHRLHVSAAVKRGDPCTMQHARGGLRGPPGFFMAAGMAWQIVR
jgi:hypothetical protein